MKSLKMIITSNFLSLIIIGSLHAQKQEKPEASDCRSNKNLKEFISLEMGDTGGDGHEKTQTQIICANINGVEMMKAYKNATAKLGFDFISDVAEEYEDSSISKKFVDKLLGLGISISLDPNDFDRRNNVYSLTPDSYLEIFLKIVKFGNSKFEYLILRSTRENHIDIGGYGLFY